MAAPPTERPRPPRPSHASSVTGTTDRGALGAHRNHRRLSIIGAGGSPVAAALVPVGVRRQPPLVGVREGIAAPADGESRGLDGRTTLRSSRAEHGRGHAAAAGRHEAASAASTSAGAARRFLWPSCALRVCGAAARGSRAPVPDWNWLSVRAAGQIPADRRRARRRGGPEGAHPSGRGAAPPDSRPARRNQP